MDTVKIEKTDAAKLAAHLRRLGNAAPARGYLFEAAGMLDALAAERDELLKDNQFAHDVAAQARTTEINATSQAKALKAEIARLTAEGDALRTALRPFADMAALYDPEDDADDDLETWAYGARPTIGQLRAARAALPAAPGGSMGCVGFVKPMETPNA